MVGVRSVGLVREQKSIDKDDKDNGIKNENKIEFKITKAIFL